MTTVLTVVVGIAVLVGLSLLVSSETVRNIGLVAAAVVALPLAIWRSMVAARQANAVQQQAAAAQLQAAAALGAIERQEKGGTAEAC